MTEARWMLYAKKADFDKIAEQYHISPVTARIIRNRGLEDMEDIGRYLYGSVEQLHNPHLLPDMDRAVEILGEKAAEGRRIRIVGDYDIDGVCSTYLLYRALKRIGAEVDYEIPDRIKDGYGINELIIEAAAEDGIDTILTCDNGIAAISQIARAKELGMTVVVTDHHDILTEAGETPEGREILPPADAVVNPKRRDSLYPFPDICGGMVAYKLVQVLYEVHKVPREEWLSLLEIAAIATVGDVMKLQGENRILVKEGLSRLGHTSNLGLRKLIEKNNLQAGSITAYHIGFVIGPCLNASGRLQREVRQEVSQRYPLLVIRRLSFSVCHSLPAILCLSSIPPRFCIIKHGLIHCAVLKCHHSGAHCIPGDIDSRPAHIQYTVNSHNQGYGLHRQAH